jgi:hypothetical protein
VVIRRMGRSRLWSEQSRTRTKTMIWACGSIEQYQMVLLYLMHCTKRSKVVVHSTISPVLQLPEPPPPPRQGNAELVRTLLFNSQSLGILSQNKHSLIRAPFSRYFSSSTTTAPVYPREHARHSTMNVSFSFI